MRWIYVLILASAAFGCGKKDDPAASSPSPTAQSASKRSGGEPQPGTPYVPGAGGVSPVQGGDYGASGGGVGQAALGRARGMANGMSHPAPASTPDSSGE